MYTNDSEKSENISFSEERKEISERKNASKKLLLLCFLVGVTGVFAGSMITIISIDKGNLKSNSIIQPEITISTQDDINFVTAVAEKNSKSVVGITIKEKIYDFFYGEREIEGMGSGVIVDKEGYILTNSHVVGDGKAKDITVRLYDNKELPGKLLWNNPLLDLAIVKIEGENLYYSQLGDSEMLVIGEPVVAIGNPYSLDLERTVTSGIVSGLNRSIRIDQNTKIEPLIQTDASINPGNSGGPLLDSKGKVIGINTAKINSAEGLGFAIPINVAKPIIEELLMNGKISNIYMGIKGVDVNTYEQKLGIDISADYGVVIIEITSNSPAEIAGLKPGDVIQKIDDKEVKTMEDIQRILLSYKPLEKKDIKFIRNGKEQKNEIIFKEKPKDFN